MGILAKVFNRTLTLLTLLFIGVLTLASNIQLVKTDIYSIDFGDTLFASIDPAGEVDTYTFSANAGDAIFVRMTQTSGNLDPEIRLHAPNGTELAINWAYNVAEIQYELPDYGEYTVLASNHYGGNYTGSYSMFVQRLSSPGNTMLVGFGETVFDSINPAGDADTYTFPAGAGDAVFTRVVQTSGTVAPEVRLYAPNGTELARSWAYSIAEISHTLVADGNYQILAFDHFGTGTGNHSIFVQRLNNAGSAIFIGYGEVISNFIETGGDADTYTFQANIGDTVFVKVTQTSGSLDPEIRLYAPNGAELARHWDSTVAEISYTLPDYGEYTVLASNHYGGNYIGNYSIFVQRINNPGNEVHISSGSTVFGSIDPAGEVDTYVFPANVDDTVFVRMSQTSGTLAPEVRLYAPNGTELARSWAYSIAEISHTITDNGQHSALAFDHFGTGMGNYSIFLTGPTGPSAPVASFTYSPSAPYTGETIIFNASSSYDSDGYIVSYRWDFSDGNITTVPHPIVTHTYTAADTYMVNLTVIDNEEFTATTTAFILVVGATKPVADAGPDQTVNEDTLVTFNGSNSFSSNEIVNYTWTFTDNAPRILIGISPTYNFTTPGTYSVILNVTDATGNWNTDTVIITVKDVTNPKAEIRVDKIVVEDKIVSFDAGNSSDNVGIVSYEWNFGDGTTGTGSTINHTYTEPGNYTATLTVRDAAGNENTHFINISALLAETALEPRSVHIVAEVVAIGTAVTATATVIGSGVGQSFNSAVSKLPFPEEIKQFLKFYSEKIFETVDKAKLAALQKASFITRGELAALGISTSVTTIVLSFVEANGLPRFLDPSVLATVIPSTLLSVCIVKITGELFEAFCTRTCRVYRRFSLWLYGLAVFLISGFVLLFPFSSPGIARYQTGEISNKTKALIVLSKMFILLMLTIPFAGLYMLGFEIIGDAGLFLTLMTVCFSLVPIRPLVGKVVFDYRKDVSLTFFTITMILLHSCAVHFLPHITYLMVGIGSIAPAAITIRQLRRTQQKQLDS